VHSQFQVKLEYISRIQKSKVIINNPREGPSIQTDNIMLENYPMTLNQIIMLPISNIPNVHLFCK